MTIVEGAAGRVAYRKATVADVVAEHAVFVAAEGELLQRHGFGLSLAGCCLARAPALGGHSRPQLRHGVGRSADAVGLMGRYELAEAADRAGVSMSTQVWGR
ncbi:MAG TPA: hypothetical protein VIV06_11070 [Candidatus Limnocylindrales bacterium]